MIDEFQDTDPVQYDIFDTIYRIGDNLPDCGLFMIGDPKQAIYSFRGADIYTYLKAREATEGRHYTLGTNYRSTKAMVDAANHCFSFAEAHPRAAFRFAKDGQNPVPFKGPDSGASEESAQVDDFGNAIPPRPRPQRKKTEWDEVLERLNFNYSRDKR